MRDTPTNIWLHNIVTHHFSPAMPHVTCHVTTPHVSPWTHGRCLKPYTHTNDMLSCSMTHAVTCIRMCTHMLQVTHVTSHLLCCTCYRSHLSPPLLHMLQVTHVTSHLLCCTCYRSHMSPLTSSAAHATGHTCHLSPPLLHIIQGDTFTVLEQEMASTSIEYGVTRRTLHLLGHLITKVLDHQLIQE